MGDIHSKIEKFLGYSVPATLLLENETLNDVVEYLVGNVTSTKPIKEENSENLTGSSSPKVGENDINGRFAACRV